jgi:tetratricopeptide (TPR) repeat protein
VIVPEPQSMAKHPRKKPRPPHRASDGRPAAGGAAAAPAPRHKPDVRIDKAQLAWEQRRYDEAIRFYEQALARSPRNPVLLVDVARAYALRYRYADAQRLVELAQSLYPHDAHVQRMLGESFALIQRYDQAIACYRRSLELAPSGPDRPHTLLELSNMYERLHQLDAARECAEEAHALAPHLEKARYALAVVDRRSGDGAGAEARWRQVIAADKAAPGVVADSWYQLASLADGAGRYDEAFDALTKAKEILARAASPYRYDAADIARTGGRTFAALTADHCERWRAAGSALKRMPGRPALLTSHPRSGTTLLEQVLDSHPDATSADELQVMPDLVYVPLGQKAAPGAAVPAALEASTVDDLNEVRHAYWAAMEGALRQPLAGRLLLDKNPEMTMLLPLVARVFPEMKIVFALRDPRDVVVSCYMQRLPLNAVSVHYLTLSDTAKKYATTMRAWLKIRDMLKNPWIEVRYEDTVADLERQARTVLEFLDLPWNDAVLQYRSRAEHKHVHSPTYEAVTRPLYTSSIGRWKNYAEQLAPHQDVLRPFVEAFGYASN